MKYQFKRGMSAILALLLVISLFSGLVVSAQAADLIKNYGYRGDTAKMFSSYATKFYSKNDVTYEELAALAGSSDVSSVPSSPLYTTLQALMRDNHTHITDYKETIEYYPYTDCQGEGDVISSFYSGAAIGPEWDSGATWNREHTWPNSKGLNGNDENDIMMLRPTASSENSGRSNKAYGISSGFYNPNNASGGLYNLHGDVARIALYVYVRWGNTGRMWGSDGVIESKDLLLDWMEEDPVDTWELGRNDVVMKITGTRNVFVDYPELAFLLFNEEIPAGMITPSGNSGESYNITATVNDPAMGSVTLVGTNIQAVPAEGCRVEGYEVVSGEATVIRSGDLFTVSAKSDCTIRINFSLIPVPETLEEMLAEASKLENKEYLPYTTTIEGQVSEIADPYSTQYKNITFYVNVNGTQVYCYRVKGEGMDTLAVGDTVKVVGNLTAHYNNPQFDSTATVTITAKAPVVEPEEPDEPDVPQGTAAVLDFSTKDQRVSFSTTKQVWANDGITLTNNKAGSTSNVGDYAGRFYKGSEVVIEYPNMTKVVFHCTGGSKYYLNPADIQKLGTVTVNSSVVTLELAEPVDSITYTCASNQNRYSKIEIYAAAPEEEGCKHENLVHVEAVTPDCETEGNVEHWYCPDCEIWWLDQELTLITNALSVKLPITHSLKHVAAKEPTCFEDGNIEYWYCELCGFAWLDEYQTKNTNLKAVVLPMAHDGLTHVEAKEPTYEAEGNIEYWYCADCGYAWLDAEGTQNTNLKAVILPKLTEEPEEEDCKHENVEYVAAVAPTCFTNGNIEHWSCPDCGYAWLDAELMRNTNQKAVILPMAHAELTHEEAKEPTCFEDGNIEYWYCEACGYAWLDAEGTQNTNLKAVTLPMAHAELTHVAAKEPTCFEDGNIEYWYCEACGYAWLDAAGTKSTNLKAVILPMAHAELTHVEAQSATCAETGNIEHWVCPDCGYAWLDAAGTKSTNLKAVTLPIDEDAHTDVTWTHNCGTSCKNEDAKCADHKYKGTCADCGKKNLSKTVKATEKHKDNDEDEYCDVCKADLSNSKTGDIVMISVLFLAVSAACLYILLLAKSPRGKYEI